LTPPLKKRLTDYANCAGCAGKIAPGALTQVLRDLIRNDPTAERRLVGIESRDDAGVYMLDDRTAIVQTVDFFAPLLDDPFVYGQIAAANALSDVYAMNARPLTTLNLVGFPDNELPMELLAEILSGVADRVRLSGAVNLGGHSLRDAEIKVGLAVTGIASPDEVVRNDTGKAGDLLVLTKPLGTGFVTTAHKQEKCPPETLEPAIRSMIQLNLIGRDAARSAGGATALTDVTGFGLAVHASEMVERVGLTVRLFIDRLPILPGVMDLIDAGIKNRANSSNRSFLESNFRQELPEEFDKRLPEIVFDPQTSGGLLIAVPPERCMALIRELRAAGAEAAAVVGRIEPRQGDAWVIASMATGDDLPESGQ
jgi:selenide,water dikinase